jgi:hypothetical protein
MQRSASSWSIHTWLVSPYFGNLIAIRFVIMKFRVHVVLLKLENGSMLVLVRGGLFQMHVTGKKQWWRSAPAATAGLSLTLGVGLCRNVSHLQIQDW